MIMIYEHETKTRKNMYSLPSEKTTWILQGVNIDWQIEIMLVLWLSFGGGQRLDVFLSRSNALLILINRARYRLKTFWPPFDNLCHKDVGRGGVGELAVLSLELCMWMLLVDHGWYRGAKSVGLGVGWNISWRVFVAANLPQSTKMTPRSTGQMPRGNMYFSSFRPCFFPSQIGWASFFHSTGFTSLTKKNNGLHGYDSATGISIVECVMFFISLWAYVPCWIPLPSVTWPQEFFCGIEVNSIWIP